MESKIEAKIIVDDCGIVSFEYNSEKQLVSIQHFYQTKLDNKIKEGRDSMIQDIVKGLEKLSKL